MRVYPSILFHLSSSGSWAGAYHSTSWTGHQSWVRLCVCVLPIRPRSTSASFSISGMLWSIVDKAVGGQSTNPFISEFTLQHFCCQSVYIRNHLSVMWIWNQGMNSTIILWTADIWKCCLLYSMPSVSSLLSVYHTMVQPHCSLLCLHDKLSARPCLLQCQSVNFLTDLQQ